MPALPLILGRTDAVALTRAMRLLLSWLRKAVVAGVLLGSILPAADASRIRKLDPLPGGLQIEEQIVHTPKFVRWEGVRGADGQMVIDFGTYAGISKRSDTLVEVRKPVPAGQNYAPKGIYDLAQRREIVPCGPYHYVAKLGAVYVVGRGRYMTNNVIEFQGVYDPVAGREIFPCNTFRVRTHPGKIMIFESKEETAVFDFNGREPEPRRYAHVAHDADPDKPYAPEQPAIRVQLARGANAPWGYIDSRGKAITPVNYTWAERFMGGVAHVRRGDKYSFIDGTGREVRPVEYAYLSAFQGGVAAFARRTLSPAGPGKAFQGADWGLVTTEGEETDGFEDIARSGYPVFQDDRVLVKHGGRWLAVYPRLPLAEALAGAIPARWKPFQGEPAPGAKSKAGGPLWGFCIPGGATMLEPRWQALGEFAGPYAPFGVPSTTKVNGKNVAITLWGLIDTTGREVMPPRYEELTAYDEHHFVVGVRTPTGYGKGLFDGRTLQVVVPPNYEAIGVAGEGAVPVKSRGRWGMVDFTGRELLKPTYASLAGFAEGLAWAELDGRAYWIDRDFKPVLADKGYIMNTNFKFGRATVWTRKDAWNRPAGKMTIDREGKVLETFPDRGPPSGPGLERGPCTACNGNGGAYRAVKVEYSGTTGDALKSYSPAGTHTTFTTGSYNKWERTGNCPVCGGSGRMRN